MDGNPPPGPQASCRLARRANPTPLVDNHRKHHHKHPQKTLPRNMDARSSARTGERDGSEVPGPRRYPGQHEVQLSDGAGEREPSDAGSAREGIAAGGGERPCDGPQERQGPLRGRCDSFVVHYPTDVNLLWDAMRCLVRSRARGGDGSGSIGAAGSAFRRDLAGLFGGWYLDDSRELERRRRFRHLWRKASEP